MCYHLFDVGAELLRFDNNQVGDGYQDEHDRLQKERNICETECLQKVTLSLGGLKQS